MDRDLLTVVVPVFNESQRSRALVSHLNTLRCAVIVVDGNSTDGTYAELRSLAGPHTQVMRASRGRATQMNAGATVAKTPYLLFLHADTTLPENGIKAVIAALQKTSLWGRFDLSFDEPTLLLKTVAWFMNWRSVMSGVCTG